MKFKIFCLMNSGKPLSNKLLDILFVNAHDMLDNHNASQEIQGRGYKGNITTKFQSVPFVSMSGILFEAEVHNEKGEVNKVKYLVRDKDNEGYTKAEWFNMTVRTLPVAPQDMMKKVREKEKTSRE